jgi:hypothetical protein
VEALKRVYNPFYEPQKGLFRDYLWQWQSDITFPATSGISPIDAISGNSFSSSLGIGIGICVALSSEEAVWADSLGLYEAYLGNGEKSRQDEWSKSIAVGSRSFVETVKQFLGIRAKGRDVVEGGQGYQLREAAADYKPLLED